MQIGKIIWGSLVALLISCSGEIEVKSKSETPGRSALFLSADGHPSLEALREIDWQDVAATAESCYTYGAIDSVLELISDWNEQPAIYLSGALELARGNPAEATSRWKQLDPSSMPANHLYTPWKLHRFTSPTEPNPFEPRLNQAVADRLLNPLTEARFLATQTSWQGALEAYLRTDPASWTTSDIAHFRWLRIFAPSARETAVLLTGALRADRVPVALRKPIAEVIKGEETVLKEQLTAALTANPELATVAITAARRQLELRQAFGEGRFQDVVDQCQNANPASATDETVLLVFLAATKTGANDLRSLWAQEFRRRNPSKELSQWIESLRKG